jgi:hypothetical protein
LVHFFQMMIVMMTVCMVVVLGARKLVVGKKERSGSTKHSIREQQKQVCLPKFRKTFLTFIGAIGKKKRCHFATLRKMYARNKTSHRMGGQKSCPDEKSVQDCTNDEEAALG